MTFKTSVKIIDATDPALQALDDALALVTDWPIGARQALADSSKALEKRFLDGEAVASLVRLRARLVDRVLVALWRELAPELANDVELIAVGGYGRGELHPGSDIDLMLLLPKKLSKSGEAASQHSSQRSGTLAWKLATACAT